MTSQDRTNREIIPYLEFILFPIAIIFGFLIYYQYYGEFPLKIITKISKIVLYYFSILTIIKIAYNEGNLQYIKKISIDLIAIIVSFLFFQNLFIFQFYIVLRQIIILIGKIFSSQPAATLFSRFRNHPAKVILISFASIILIGTAFLSLPISSANGDSIGIANASFTATSATCVTGLIVLDTGSDFSLFGKIVILILMQIGGLGIMTFSTMLFILLGKQIGLGQRSLMEGVLASSENMLKLIKTILITTFSFEFLGALFLFFKFRTILPTIKSAIGYSIFHSISGFCNAGFCLYSDSLTKFQGNWLVNIVMLSLIICGGIGFAVLLDTKNVIFRKKRLKNLSLHSKIVLTFTIFLIVVSAIFIFIFEYNNFFHKLPLKDGILASIFQSVTTRTAGFNTINIGEIGSATALLMIVLMFIGASPGSTGGGLKTTTFAILVLSVWSIIRGRDDVEIFHRTIPQKVTRKIMALAAISLTILISLILVLCLSENAPFKHIIFEAFSAFGTVGLSMGLTPNLTGIGKIAVILLMYLGRVGPLTIAFALGERRKKVRYRYTEEDIAIG
ncbi:MAG: potassium transporter Trk [Candidatus Cloacimonetes bacterium]|nr:potassium transporter Trk [Candidatus Cloacimonadota bacterium]